MFFAIAIVDCCSLFVAVLVDNFQLTLYATHGDAKDNKTLKMMDDEDEDNLSTSEFVTQTTSAPSFMFLVWVWQCV